MGATYSTNDTPCPRSFICKTCGEEITITNRSDHRTVFCSQYCAREYWRHRARYDRKNALRDELKEENDARKTDVI